MKAHSGASAIWTAATIAVAALTVFLLAGLALGGPWRLPLLVDLQLPKAGGAVSALAAAAWGL